MKTTMFDLRYESILEMASAFQWVQDKQCIRLANQNRTTAPEDEILASLNEVAERITMLEVHCLMSGRPLHYLSAALSFHFGSVRVGNEDILSIAADLSDRIGLDQSLVGNANFYTIAYALHIRTVYPDRWNRFCDRVQQPVWKTTLQTVTPTGLQISIDLAESVDLPADDCIGNESIDKIEKTTGIATALEHPDYKMISQNIMKNTGIEGPQILSTEASEDSRNPNADLSYQQQLEEQIYKALAEEAMKKKNSKKL